jgi:hypothetical protein
MKLSDGGDGRQPDGLPSKFRVSLALLCLVIVAGVAGLVIVLLFPVWATVVHLSVTVVAAITEIVRQRWRL